MFVSMFAMAAAATAAQATDTTRASREAFTGCLRQYVTRVMEDRMTQEAFDREFPQACAAQQSAFREAIIRRETALRATRGNAESQAELEIEDARFNFADRFVAAPAPSQPAAQAQAPAQATAQPEGQPAVQQASAPAEPTTAQQAPAQPQ